MSEDNPKILGNNIMLEKSLYDFARLSNNQKRKRYKDPSVIEKTKIRRIKDGYEIIRDGTSYKFWTFTNKNIEQGDIDYIRTGNFKFSVLVDLTLEIAGYPGLIEPHFILCTVGNKYKALAEYKKNGKSYIVDTEYDLIMEKDDYYKLMNVNEVRVLNIHEIYYLHIILEKIKYKIPVLHFILSYDKLMPYYLKKFDLKFEGYNNVGINNKNNYIFGSDRESIFRLTPNRENNLFIDFKNLNEITLSPDNYSKNEKGEYEYKDYHFTLLSDILEDGDEEAKGFLLSKYRFKVCHQASVVLLRFLDYSENKDYNITLVIGKCCYDGKRFLYHSWLEIEIDNEIFVYDFTQNLIMKKSEYYRYINLILIVNKENKNEVIELYNILKEYDLPFNYCTRNILGNEILNDLKKNEQILKK